MNNNEKKDTVPMGTAIAIIVGVIVFALAFIGIGGFVLYQHLQNPASEANQAVQDEPSDYVQAGQPEWSMPPGNGEEDGRTSVEGRWELITR